MRRLLLAAALLAMPAVAKADPVDVLFGQALYPAYYLNGCSNPLVGCLTGMAMQLQPTTDPTRYFAYLLGDESAPYSFARYHVSLYDSNANLLYRYGNGDVPGYLLQTAPPAFGIAELESLNSNLTGEHLNGTLAVGLTVTTTPEPASTILLGSGLLGFAAVRRRRQQTQNL